MDASNRALVAVFFLSALALISVLAAKRMPSKISQLRKLSVARWLVLLNLIDS